MRKIYPKIEKADLIVFGRPNYGYSPTGKMKFLLGRLRPFVAHKKLKTKKWMMVSPSADGPHSCRLLVEMLYLVSLKVNSYHFICYLRLGTDLRTVAIDPALQESGTKDGRLTIFCDAE